MYKMMIKKPCTTNLFSINPRPEQSRPKVMYRFATNFVNEQHYVCIFLSTNFLFGQLRTLEHKRGRRYSTDRPIAHTRTHTS